jgi:hypothetical protein
MSKAFFGFKQNLFRVAATLVIADPETELIRRAAFCFNFTIKEEDCDGC